jgi:hypothetical protein
MPSALYKPSRHAVKPGSITDSVIEFFPVCCVRQILSPELHYVIWEVTPNFLAYASSVTMNFLIPPTLLASED